MNFFKTCFTANEKVDFDFETVEKNENPHQRLTRNLDNVEKMKLKDSEKVPNILEVRGVWKHRGQEPDFKEAGHKQ